jgi:hypothetical protein
VPSSRIGRWSSDGCSTIALEAVGERAQLGLGQALGDQQVPAHGHVVPGALERVEGVNRGGAVRVVQQGQRGHGLILGGPDRTVGLLGLVTLCTAGGTGTGTLLQRLY